MGLGILQSGPSPVQFGQPSLAMFFASVIASLAEVPLIILWRPGSIVFDLLLQQLVGFFHCFPRRGLFTVTGYHTSGRPLAHIETADLGCQTGDARMVGG